MTKVKICGITNLEDARHAIDVGADALGFNFYEKSPRYLHPQPARPIVERLPEDVEKIGVFVNMEESRIGEFVDLLGLTGVQLHGDEDRPFIDGLRAYTSVKIIKAIRVGPDFQVDSVTDYDADGILLDGYDAHQFGGTGILSDWYKARKVADLVPELFLAGGLTPENVSEAVRAVRPYTVDVASGVESSPGKKDPAKVAAFVKAAKEAI